MTYSCYLATALSEMQGGLMNLRLTGVDVGKRWLSSSLPFWSMRSVCASALAAEFFESKIGAKGSSPPQVAVEQALGRTWAGIPREIGAPSAILWQHMLLPLVRRCFVSQHPTDGSAVKHLCPLAQPSRGRHTNIDT